MGPIEAQLRLVADVTVGCRYPANALDEQARDVLFGAVTWLNFLSPYAHAPSGRLLDCVTINSAETWSEAIEAAEALDL